MKRTLVILATLMLLLLSGGQAFAGSIEYQDSAYASGTLGGQRIIKEMVTVIMIGDTNNVFCDGFGLCSNFSSEVFFCVSMLGCGSFTDGAYVQVHHQLQTVTFLDLLNDHGILGTRNAAFFSYELMGPIGPTTGLGLGTILAIPTSLGDLEINSFEFGTSTFSAFSPIPEPGSLSLLATFGLITMGLVRRKMKL